MKIKRYFAPDIRQAMRMVRDEQGPDAVILSNRRVEGGVEIVAALDFDEQAIQEKLSAQAQERVPPSAADKAAQSPPPVSRPLAAEAAKLEAPHPSAATADLLARLRGGAASRRETVAASSAPVSAVTPPPAAEQRQSAPAPARRSTAAASEYVSTPTRPVPPESSDGDALAQVREELRSLRQMVDLRLAEAGWRASACGSNTTRLDVLRGLSERGFAKDVALHLANRLGAMADSEAAWRQAEEILARQLPVADDQLLEYGGIAALVGPTGVGKTTTIAKLAAKFRIKHGPRQVALITIDNYRIAAHDHLHTYGRLLDVPVAIAANGEQLQRALQGFLDKKLVLIDTAGMGQHDGRLAAQLSLLKDSAVPIKPYLVLSAASQLRAMEQVLRAFGDCRPQACILTKLDEAAQPATALSALMRHRLPLSFVADGQQVPEDLHVARAADLIRRCFSTPQFEEGNADGYAFEDWVTHGAL